MFPWIHWCIILGVTNGVGYYCLYQSGHFGTLHTKKFGIGRVAQSGTEEILAFKSFWPGNNHTRSEFRDGLTITPLSGHSETFEESLGKIGRKVWKVIHENSPSYWLPVALETDQPGFK